MDQKKKKYDPENGLAAEAAKALWISKLYFKMYERLDSSFYTHRFFFLRDLCCAFKVLRCSG